MTFSNILNISVSGSWLVIAIVLLRPVLKKAPKSLVCWLWVLVAVRLLCPVLPSSPVSLIPSAQIVPEHILSMEPPDSGGQQVVMDLVTNPIYPQSVDIQLSGNVGWFQWRDLFWTLIWWGGMGAMAVYALYSYLRLHLQTRIRIKLRDNIWLCDDIDSPFIIGVLRPRICLPSCMDPVQIPHVIAHEQAHLKRLDHWWKPLGFGLLTIHWFNPVMWLGYILLCRDIELACDECVIRGLDRNAVRAYSEALVACGTRTRLVAACPLAFGEVGVKARVKSMLRYRKPGFWIILTAFLLSLILAACFLTNPMDAAIGNLKEPQFDRLFENVELLTFRRGEQSHSFRDPEQAFLNRLNDIEITANPIDRNLGERDRTYEVEADGAVLCISVDFSRIWVDDPVKPSYTYGVKEPQVLEALLLEWLTPSGENEENGGEGAALLLQGTYVPRRCLYFHMLSNFYPMLGDHGAAYHFQESGVTVETRNGGVVSYDPVVWEWQSIDWDSDFFRQLAEQDPNRRDSPSLKTMVGEKAMYQMLNEDTFLIFEDGRVLYGQTVAVRSGDISLWSLYELMPGRNGGIAEWISYTGYSSLPGFGFEFDMEYTHVTAVSEAGELIAYDKPAHMFHPPGDSIEVYAGRSLYWCPWEHEGGEVTEGCFAFTVYNGEAVVCSGTVSVTSGMTTERGDRIYTASLAGDGLYLEQSSEYQGGVIRLTPED